ncbi:MAG: glycosyltransferase family 2 protein [Clostridiales bacterium]|nr:glycosyltransferase family 2 protein [Clostridiales bacterium]
MNKEWQVPTYDVIEIEQKKCNYCLCIPVINEGERILKQLDRVKPFLGQVDLLLLDGGSTDGSTELEKLRAKGVTTLLVKTGSGKLSAQLRMGYAYALEKGYKGIITVDGNGKDNVDAIPSFVQALEEGWDMVQGSRYIPGGQAINTPKIRHFAVKLIHVPVVSKVAGFKYTDTTNGYRGYSTRYLLHNEVQPFRDIFNTYELLAYLSVRAPQLGLRTKEIPVTRAYPPKGKTPTKISFFKGNSDLLKILWELINHKYDPKNEVNDGTTY